MLWWKAWLETRWRLPFITLLILWPIAVNHATEAGDGKRMAGAVGVLLIFAGIYVSGAGIQTQSTFRRSRGLHGSTYYTLSLPVSRLRLLGTRALAGMLELTAIAGLVLASIWVKFPLFHGQGGGLDFLALLVSTVTCLSLFYALAVMFATFLDDTWHIFGSIIAIAALGWLSLHLAIPRSADPLRVLLGLFPVSQRGLPWAAMLGSLLISAILFMVSWRIVERREY